MNRERAHRIIGNIINIMFLCTMIQALLYVPWSFYLMWVIMLLLAFVMNALEDKE